ncbi:MAG: AAA family ATPase [Myxococcaceae bacterium]|nr:AAA family ATPase [Myxococcaceae bacterium]
MARKNGAEQGERYVDRDLTALAREGRLPEAHGADAVVTEVLALLARGGKHPLLAGEPGVGKTALVQEVARRLAEGRVDAALAGMRLVEVSALSILAQGQRHAPEVLEELFQSLARAPGAVVYVRDLTASLEGPLAPVLLRAMRTGALRFIFEAEQQRVQELQRADEALAERLHVIPVPEPTPEKARWILGRVAEQLERELRLPIDPLACDLALRLSSRFLLARRLPRKAIELLQETASEAAAASRDRVGPEDVLARFCAATRLPRFLVDDAMPLELDEVERLFGERILGQTDAVSAVLRAVALLKAGLNDPRRPLGVFLFAGPTGVGKTHLAKLLAEYLFGSGDRLVRLNMADYASDGDEALPFGAPWAATLEAKRGELTRLLDGKVFSVLLLDEFEKAARSVHDRFLQLFDEGRFVNAAGETVSCSNTLIVATSNVGAEVYREKVVGFAGVRSTAELVHEVDRRITAAFRHEFLNRFDAVCHFQPLSKVEIRRIAQREVGRVLEREGIRARALDVEVSPAVLDLLVDRGYSPEFGARYLQREIEKSLTAALAVEIARRPLPPGTPVRVEARTGGRVVAVAEPLAPREATAQLTLPSARATAVKRRLDRRSLLEETDALVRRVERVARTAHRPELEKRRADLLQATQAPDLWDAPERAAATLRAFRQVEAQLSELDRLASTCQFARKLVREARGEAQLKGAARQVEEAARDIQLAEARVASGTAEADDEALMDLWTADVTPADTTWLAELAAMYSAWAARRGYQAVPLAEGQQPPRVVLRVTGPGAFGFLKGETGLHRRIAESSRVRAYVRVHRAVPHAAVGAVVGAREVRRHVGSFLPRVGCEVTLRDESSGRLLSLLGGEVVRELEEVAQVVLAGGGAPVTEARRYHVGRAPHVEDPRTGAGTPRLKDVLRGELDLFIAAWVSRPPDAPESPVVRDAG